MYHEVSDGKPYPRLFLLGISRHAGQHFGKTSDIFMRKTEQEMLRIMIDQAENKLVVVPAAVEGIVIHIGKKISRPAAVPLIVKAKSALLGRSGYLRPICSFFGDHQDTAILFMYRLVQRFDEILRLQVLVSPIDIGNPAARRPIIIQVNDFGDIGNPQTVHMTKRTPVKCTGQQIIHHFFSAKIEGQITGLRLALLGGLCVFIEGAAVCTEERLIFFGKKGGGKVQNDTNPVPVQRINDLHEMLHPSDLGGKRKKIRDGIGIRIVMFHYRHKFHGIKPILLHQMKKGLG